MIAELERAAQRVYAAVDELNAAIRSLPSECEVDREWLFVGTMEHPHTVMLQARVTFTVPRGAA